MRFDILLLFSLANFSKKTTVVLSKVMHFVVLCFALWFGIDFHICITSIIGALHLSSDFLHFFKKSCKISKNTASLTHLIVIII